MAIEPRLDLRQTQTLSMTPQLQQAIKLLQLSNIELQDYLAEELEKNPLLEQATPDDLTDLNRDDPLKSAAEAEYHNRAENDRQAGEDIQAIRDRNNDGYEQPLAREADLDTEFDNNWTNMGAEDIRQTRDGFDDGGNIDPTAYETRDQSMRGAGQGGDLKFENPDYNFENRLGETIDLMTVLADQVRLTFADEKDRFLAAVFIDHLDAAGYVNVDLEKMAKNLGIAVDRLTGVLKKLQGFEPTGIFARDLRECLALQLQEKNRLDPMMQMFLDHLDMLERHDFAGLRKKIGCSEDDMTDMLSEIRALDPKPALKFDQVISQTMIPDVIMKPLPKSSGGGWAVELNSDTLPRVLINKTYYAEIKQVATDKDSKAFVNEHWQNANWLVKALDQRANTILKVAEQIIRQQNTFFVYGVEYLKPLVLRDVAAVIGMHESTVSRVTTNKYMATPRGVFELKYFFTSTINSADGAVDYSSQSVKAKIKSLIGAEDPKKILSDAKIAEILKKQGVDIARRTVVKYREAMGIGSSVDRRRQKNPKL